MGTTTINQKNDARAEQDCDFDPKDKYEDKDALGVKVYKPRDSILTELFENIHFRTVHNICCALLIMCSITTVVHDAMYKQELNIGLGLITAGFRNFHLFWAIWISMFGTSLLPYLGLKCWVLILDRTRYRNGTVKTFWNALFLFTYVMQNFFSFYFYTKMAFTWNLGIALRMAVSMENLRFIMKSYAFVRSNIGKFLGNDKRKKFDVSFKHYLYFSFAPVLVYRDSYPRSNKKIRWNIVGFYLLNVVLGVFCYSFLFQSTYIADLRDYGKKSYTWKDIVMIILKYGPVALLKFLMLFYMSLHSWYNAFGEVLQFSDRHFYKDWWNSSKDDEFLRRWNLVIHDWLYTYIYKEFHENVFPKRKFVARVLVFVLVAMAHDYVSGSSVGFCIPLFCSQYCFLVLMGPFQVENKTVGSILMVCKLSLQASVVLTFCTMEYFARVNCPNQKSEEYDIFIPRFIKCK